MSSIPDLFRHLTAGVYVIGVANGERRDAFTASAVMQVSFSPLLVALGISPAHESYTLLHDAGAFAISVLSVQQQELAKHFGTQSGRTVDKLASTRWRTGVTGAPLLCDALAHFECRVVNDIEAGDHRLILAHVVDGAIANPNGEPMLYAQTGNLDGSESLYPATFS
jgi:flavin reductase (DIM6/NTAB) family NADH-FMN oxidoreductase RutF